jgi:hypothetical protein
MARNRSISSIIGNKPTKRPSQPRSSRKKRDNKVPCYCNKCNGKLVLKRTKLFHESAGGSTTIQDSGNEQLSTELLTHDAGSPPHLEPETGLQPLGTETADALRTETSSPPHLETETDSPALGTEPHSLLRVVPRRRPRRYTSYSQVTDDMSDSEVEQYIESSLSEEEDSEHYKRQRIDSDDAGGSDSDTNLLISENFEDYSPPNYEPPQNEEEPTIDGQFSWILLWIMNFRIRFNISETATESLVKFMKLVLTEIGGNEFTNFPSTLYLAKKSLGLNDRFHSFVPCPKCHKLYNKDEVVNFRQNVSLSIMRCNHIEFPNSSSRRLKPCDIPLSRKPDNSGIIQPELIFPFAGIREQLAAMYRRKGFENSLRHWANRSGFDDILTDIYDGRVWKTFKGTDDVNFFRPEVADSHLGLMLNLDWFQPFDGTSHSTGVLYAAICNLPRDIRFKRENLLIISILPGPNEVRLHKINHYLAPMVDELGSLWGGMTLNRTYEYREGRQIRAALILVTCDIPAARKICGHISALAACHRCEKRGNYENHQHNFAGMEDMDEWFIARDSSQHRQNAIGWRRCNSDAARTRFVKQTGVRWSELLRLPYFDPIRFLTVDPMHCLFLGIAKWIVKRIWVDEGVLTPDNLKNIQRKMNQIQVPADLGRIPRKIDCGEGFSNFTADQWRIFFTIYATTSLWEYLSAIDRTILTHFVRICSVLVGRILTFDLIAEATERLIKIIKLIEERYGRDKITPNLHLSLHLQECSYDFGPLYTFWCFSFERMNGILGNCNFFHCRFMIIMIMKCAKK